MSTVKEDYSKVCDGIRIIDEFTCFGDDEFKPAIAADYPVVYRMDRKSFQQQGCTSTTTEAASYSETLPDENNTAYSIKHDLLLLLQYQELRTIIAFFVGLILAGWVSVSVYRVTRNCLSSIVGLVVIFRFICVNLHKYAQGPQLDLQSHFRSGTVHEKTFVVTGGARGVGLEIVTLLCELGAKTVIVCGRRGKHRKTDILVHVVEEMKRRRLELKTEISVVNLDLNERESVEKCCSKLSELECIDCLVCNAGILRGDTAKQIMTVNWANHVALIEGLRRNVKKVVTLSSVMHGLGRITKNGSDNMSITEAYATSKLFMLFEAQYVADEYGIASAAIHPGWVGSDMSKFNIVADVASRVLAKTPRSGAMSVLYGVMSESNNFAGYVESLKFLETFESDKMNRKAYKEARKEIGF